MILRFGRYDKNARTSALKRAVSVLTAVTAVISFAGCRAEQTQSDPQAIRIALVCRADMDYNIECYKKGIEMAIEEYDGDYAVSVEVYNDATNFEESIELNNSLASNPDITAVISMQDYEVTDVSARTMNDNNKAFFAVQGSYSKTAQEKYTSFFPFSLSSEHLGYAAALYVNAIGAQRVGIIHSGTEFELEEATAFDRMAVVSGIKTVSSLSESFSTAEFLAEMDRWESMDVEIAYVPYYRSYWAADIVANINEILPEVGQIAYFTFSSAETMELASEVTGLVVPAGYPVEQGEAYDEFTERFLATYGEIPDNEAVQGYDIANLIIQNYSGDNTALSENIRANAQNADGVAGDIVRDLIIGLPEITYEVEDSYPYEYLILQDGKFVHLDM